MIICKKCNIILTLIYKDILYPDRDIFECSCCGMKIKRYDKQEENKS